jgi:ectoine hydroxylase-related dioxygenase (phytanoyl-CoA dioxygenase family)
MRNQIAELEDRGYCVLKECLPEVALRACREAFWPTLLKYLVEHRDEPNRGPNRHFLPMSFDPPCFTPEFFFNAEVLGIVRRSMDDRIVADQWGCDAPLKGSTNQEFHVDYRRPLFPEALDLLLPIYMLVVSFGLVDITSADGPIEIVPGTHRLSRVQAVQAVEAARIMTEPITMKIGDVLIRHPWALHRGTAKMTDTPRALLTVRYVRRWYADGSRDVNSIPRAVWHSLTSEQRDLMRFPVLSS